MTELSRRFLLKTGAAAGVAGVLPQGALADEDGSHSDGSHGSHGLEKYVKELPILEERTPDVERGGAVYHDVSIEQSTHEFHPDLGETTIWGFDGQFPGPVLTGWQNRPFAVEFDNSALPDEHIFEVDERIEGTTTENYVGYDGEVPEVRNVTHFHGLKVDSSNDGQAEMWTSPDGVTGPRFEDSLQVLPNRQSRLTSTYHDHARGISRLNNYAGLVGPYQIKSWQGQRLNLPDGEYDVPLVLADRSFTEDGELDYPDMFQANVAGDTATVNGAAWPYMEVEPRTYRFRLINASNGRTYDLGLSNDAQGDDEHQDVPTLYQISAGHGFLEEVASIDHHSELHSLTLAPFERAEIVVDFSEYAGETFTVTNDAAFPYNGGMDHDDGMGGHDEGGHGGGGHGDSDHPQIHEIMQFRVTDEVTQHDRTTHPTDLSLPERRGPDPDDAQETREITMEMEMPGMGDGDMGDGDMGGMDMGGDGGMDDGMDGGMDGGDDGMDGGDDGMDMSEPMLHTLNGKRWGDPVEIKPELGSTEIWELVNDDEHTHPIHLHLVEFEVVERERHDSDEGPQPPLPNERGGKDVVRVDPGETVRIAVEFEGYTGKFPFHCHILEHEEHDMMRPFEVVEPEDDDDDWPPGHGGKHPGRGRGRRGRGHPGRGRGRRGRGRRDRGHRERGRGGRGRRGRGHGRRGGR